MLFCGKVPKKKATTFIVSVRVLKLPLKPPTLEELKWLAGSRIGFVSFQQEAQRKPLNERGSGRSARPPILSIFHFSCLLK